MSVNNLSFNLHEATKFLDALAGYSDAEFTFQTFDDDQTRKSARPKGEKDPFAIIIHGRFTNVVSELMALNQKGAGIHVCVNVTDFKGRRKENIVAVRSAFADKDDGDLPELKLQPSIIVQSKRGQHAYWFLKQAESLHDFTRVQEALIHNFKTDVNMAQINRVMRLPGFFHMKDPSNPFLVKLVTQNNVRYSIDEILSVYPSKPQKHREKRTTHGPSPKRDISSFHQWAKSLPTEESAENSLGGRNKTLHFLICEGLAQEVSEDELSCAAYDYCERSGLPESEADEMLVRLPREHAKKPFKSYQQTWTGPFEVTDQGVFYVELDKDGKPKKTRICSRLDVIAYTRDGSNESWGRLLQWEDRDGHLHKWAMPMEMLRGDGADFRGYLLSHGLVIAPGFAARNLLAEYIQTVRPVERARCVSRSDWHGETYVLPNKSFGPKVDGERVILQTASDSHHTLRTSGTLEEWQQNVAKLCTGNSRLVFGVSVAFAPTLLNMTNEESGGFHLRGTSSLGKTKALRVAGSVWGGGGINGYDEKWRATVNGLEAVAQAHCDALLTLDELGEIDPRHTGQAAYMLANGSGKNRADKNGAAKKKAEWRLLFLPSGEISLADHMNEAGQRAKAGQETRMIDLPADDGKGHGLFENLHGAANGDVFATQLEKVSKEFYGTAVVAFLEKLTADDSAKQYILKVKDVFLLAANIPKDASGQVHRVAGRFALVAAAGELAIHYDVVPWPKGEAITAALTCFDAWLDQRGGFRDHEVASAVNQVRAFLQQNEARFTYLVTYGDGDDESPPQKWAGCKREVSEEKREWLVFPEVFKKEVCAGFDPKLVTRILIEQGSLISDPNGKSSQPVRIPALGKSTRVYVINELIMGDVNEPS